MSIFKFSLIISLLFFFFLSSVNISYCEESITAKLFNDGGTVNFQKGGQGNFISVPAGSPALITIGDIVETKDNTKAHMELPGGNLINLQANTRIKISNLVKKEGENRSIFKLFMGTISVFVNKLTGAKDTFEVETPTSVASVRGTQFEMCVYEDEKYKKKEEKNKEVKENQTKDEQQENKDKTMTVVSVEEGQIDMTTEDRKQILTTVVSNTTVFVTPDLDVQPMNEFIDLMGITQEDLKERVRGEIENYLYQQIPIPHLPF